MTQELVSKTEVVQRFQGTKIIKKEGLQALVKTVKTLNAKEIKICIFKELNRLMGLKVNFFLLVKEKVHKQLQMILKIEL